MKNGKAIVPEASEGMTFRMQEKKGGIVVNSYSYGNPKIPEGYVHLKGTWENGFVIQNEADKSEFVWIPVGWLDNDAVLDRKHPNEKIGRINWFNSNFSDDGYHEETDTQFVESVKKYGGFYFARYHASRVNEKLVFQKGNMPWVNINYFDAVFATANYAEGSKDVQSCITNGAAFDAVIRWIIKSKAKTLAELIEDSTNWGNYWNSENSPRKVMPTGSEEKWSVLNIYDIAGNVDEWTSEWYWDKRRVLRGGVYCSNGNYWTAARRFNLSPFFAYNRMSFRAVLYLK